MLTLFGYFSDLAPPSTGSWDESEETERIPRISTAEHRTVFRSPTTPFILTACVILTYLYSFQYLVMATKDRIFTPIGKKHPSSLASIIKLLNASQQVSHG